MRARPGEYALLYRAFLILAAVAAGFVCAPVQAAGTTAGTDIANTAEVRFEVAGNPVTEPSNTLVITVAEIVDVDVTLQSPQTPVTPGDIREELLFTLTNTGNGTETFRLIMDSAVAGDDFDPTPSVPDFIFFDTDGSGDLSPGDTPYTPGGNDPTLAPDASVAVLIANDIPAAANDGDLGQSRLLAESTTGTGAPGTVFAGAGDGGVDALAGNSGGDANDTGEYIVSDVDVAVAKSATVADPFGGTEPVPGAEITYQVLVTVTGSGTAVAAAFDDQVPANTTFVAGSITLNGAPLTDAPDADAGQFVSSGTPTVNVALGDLTSAAGAQTVEFRVVID